MVFSAVPVNANKTNTGFPEPFSLGLYSGDSFVEDYSAEDYSDDYGSEPNDSGTYEEHPYGNSYNEEYYQDDHIVDETEHFTDHEGKTKKYSDYNGDWRSYLTDLADSGDAAAIDKLVNYLMSEESAQRQRDWDSHAYSRLVDDLKSAGINPYALMSSAGSPVSSASGNSYSGSQYTSRAAAEETARHNQATESVSWLKSFLSIASIVAAVFIAAI